MFRPIEAAREHRVLDEAGRRAQIEKVDIRLHHLVAELLQWGYVIDDVDAAAVCTDDQIVVTLVNEDVIDADSRQSVHETLPFPSAVQRYEERVLGTEIKKVAVPGILADDVDVAFRQVARD